MYINQRGRLYIRGTSLYRTNGKITTVDLSTDHVSLTNFKKQLIYLFKQPLLGVYRTDNVEKTETNVGQGQLSSRLKNSTSTLNY